jgi:colanic acid/amylovoran biosynthesis glycosyltransferase
VKILYVSWEYPKLSESFVSNEVGLLLEAGHDVRIFTMKRGSLATRDEAARIYCAIRTTPRSPVRALRCLPTLGFRRLTTSPILEVVGGVAALMGVAQLGSWRPDVIHGHFLNQSATIALRMGGLMGVPCTLMAHAGDWTVGTSVRELSRKLDLADHTFAISHQAVEGIVERSSADPSKLSVQRAIFKVRAAGTGADRNSTTIVAVARLVPKKGLDTLIDAMPTVVRRHPDARLVIIGEGSLRTALSDQIHRRGLENVVNLAGAQSHEGTQSIVASSAVFALPCREMPDGDADGIPVALMEAIALGVPVISTPVAGIPELITSTDEGLLVPQDEPAALAQAIVTTLSDRVGAAARADNARARLAAEFSAELQIARLEDVWSQLVRKRPRVR